jgi:hypothetical protein
MDPQFALAWDDKGNCVASLAQYGLNASPARAMRMMNWPSALLSTARPPNGARAGI